MVHIDIKTGIICEYCGKDHDGSYGSGRFCNKSCATKYAASLMTPEGKQHSIDTIRDPLIRQKAINSTRKYYEQYKLENKKKKKKKHSPSYRPKSIINDFINKSKKRIGTVGEYAVIKKFIECGIDVFVPVCDDNKTDLLAFFNGKYQRIQVKTSTCSDGEITTFTISQSRLSISDNKTHTHAYIYTKDDVDYFALYDYYTGRIFLIENINLPKYNINIRYSIPKNNQQTKIKYADDYDFDKVLNELGYENVIDLDEDDYELIEEDINNDDYYCITINA